MKIKIWIIILIILVLIIPIPGGRYRDGGTKEYKSLIYRVVVWNHLMGDGSTYYKTSVFWFPDNYKSIDELWKIEYDQDMDGTNNTSAANGIYNINYELGSIAGNFIS